MHKIVTLIKRRSDLSVENFQTYWAGHHGPLMKQAPGIRRYVQSHALPQGYRRGELLFDGISELWFEDESAYEHCLNSNEFKAAVRDLDVFVDRTRMVEMPVDVHVIKDGAILADAVKNIEFVNRRPGMALETFRAYWRNVHGPIASKIAVICRYEQNHLKLTAYDKGAQPYDGLAITWFASTADMKLGATTREYQSTRADEPNFLPDGHLPIIIVREREI